MAQAGRDPVGAGGGRGRPWPPWTAPAALLAAALAALAWAVLDGEGGARTELDEAGLDAKLSGPMRDGFVEFRDAMARSDGGAVRLFTMQGRGTDGVTPGDVRLEIEWGVDGTQRVKVQGARGFLNLTLESFCRAGSAPGGPNPVVVVDGVVYEAREGGRIASCTALRRDFAPTSPIGPEDLVQVRTADGGAVEGLFANGTAAYWMRMDSRGHVVAGSFTEKHAAVRVDGVFEADWAPRRELEVPQPERRMPAEVTGASTFDAAQGSYLYVVANATERPPLSEMEVRVHDAGRGTLLAAFPMSGSASSAGFGFHMQDQGAPGRLDAGDRFTLNRDGWDNETQYRVVLFDAWAQAEVGERPVPGVGACALAALALAGLARRRR